MNEIDKTIKLSLTFSIYFVVVTALSPALGSFFAEMIGAGFIGYALAIAKIMDLSSILDIISIAND